MCEKKGLDFFRTCKAELVKAHETKSRKDLNDLCRKLTRDLKPYSNMFARSVQYLDADDYIQAGLLGLIKCLQDYRYICPVCRERFSERHLFKDHCLHIHGEVTVTKPQTSLAEFCSHVIRRYMINTRKYVFHNIRTPFSICDTEITEVEIPYGKTPEDIYATKEAIEKLKNFLDKERNEKVKIFISRLLQGDTKKQACAHVANSGLAKSTNSARISFHYMRQNERLQKYRRVLSCE